MFTGIILPNSLAMIIIQERGIPTNQPVQWNDGWWFPKIVVPPNHPFVDVHSNPFILGYPHVWKAS